MTSTATTTQTWNILNITTDTTHEIGTSDLPALHEILTVLNRANPADTYVAIEA